MKKYLFFALLAAAGLAYADATVTSATKARAAAMDKGLEQVVAVGDVSGGDTVEVDARGSASVLEYPKKIVLAQGGVLGGGTNVVSGACRVTAVIFGGSQLAAGDYIQVYDALTVTGTPKLEIVIGTAKDTHSLVIPGGITFSTGVTLDSSAEGVASVIYDN